MTHQVLNNRFAQNSGTVLWISFTISRALFFACMYLLRLTAYISRQTSPTISSTTKEREMMSRLMFLTTVRWFDDRVPFSLMVRVVSTSPTDMFMVTGTSLSTSAARLSPSCLWINTETTLSSETKSNIKLWKLVHRTCTNLAKCYKRRKCSISGYTGIDKSKAQSKQ